LGLLRVQAAVEAVLVAIHQQVVLVDQVEAVVSIHQERQVPHLLQLKVLQVVLDIVEQMLIA